MTRKTTIRVILAVGTLLLASATQSLAVEGLNLSLQCSNVVLGWPSSDTNNEYFIVQYRPTLSSTDTWQTLATWLPADYGTNRTYFVHTNAVQHPNCGGGSFAAMAEGADESSSAKKFSLFDLGVPLATRADGTGSVVPLALYPPGFDLSSFLIFDPASSNWFKGSTSLTEELYLAGLDDPQPQDGDDAGTAPDTGFYRVVRHGITLLGITNGMTFSGIVTILVEAGNDSGSLTSLSLNENDAPVTDLSSSQEPFAIPLSLTVDTTRMSNGVHEISVSGSWYIPGADNPYFQAISPSVTINVQNEISFPNWMPLFGQLYDALYITAQSAHTDADWYIDVYGGNAGYIGTFGGHTYDGNIEAAWNLTGPPPNFVSYTNEPYFDFVVTTFFDDGQSQGNGPQGAGSASATAPGTRKNWDRWASHGDWVVANQLFWEGWVGGENLNTMADTFVGMAEQAFGLTVRPNHAYGEAFRIHYDDSNEVSSWQAFRQALYHPNSRNLFYSGHGGNSGIGYNAADTNVFIKRSEIATNLHTMPIGLTNRHAFRFVFLDGCETANGRLPDAFGIVHQKELPFQYYYNSGERYSAFVGWNKSPTAGYAGHLVKPDHWKFIMNFQYAWLTEGQGVREALNRSKYGPLNNSVEINPKHLTVFGYRDFGPNQHNRQ